MGASRQRSVPLSNVSQPRRYSSVSPMVLSGIVSQTIHRVPAWSSKSRSAMRHADCTGQTTAADQLRTGGMASWRSRGPSLAWNRSLTYIPVVALSAADAVSPPAPFDHLGDVSARGPDGSGRPDGLVRRPGAPPVQEPAARGRLDRLPELVRCRPIRLTACLRAAVTRIGPRVHAAGAVGLDPKYWRTGPQMVKIRAWR